jgi:DNA-binding LacI/PurR family transcriptional regulator
MPSNGVRRVSMMDIARHAGVSQKTVSRVVNDEPNVSQTAREAVRQAIAELGFRPNAAARALVTRRSRRIGMVTVTTTAFGPASILEGVERAARSAGYALSIARTVGEDLDDYHAAIERLVDEGVEAIVLSEPFDLGHPELPIPDGLPLLSFDAPDARYRRDELVVGADEVMGARSATEHLLALGHPRVHHIAGPPTWAATGRRIRGWRAALDDAGVDAPSIASGDWSPAAGYEAMRELLRREAVTAVFVANDSMAIGAMRAVQDAGLSVPRDVSIAGFDDTPEAAYLAVPLTTVRQDFAEVTRLAMHRLFRTIDGHPPTERHRHIPTQLVVRESTAAPA